MGRLFAVLVLTALICTGVAYYFDMLKTPGPKPLRFDNHPLTASQGPRSDLNLGGPLFAPKALSPLSPDPSSRSIDPIRITGVLTVKVKQEVPSQIEGEIAYIGEGVPHDALLIAGTGPFLVEPFGVVVNKLPQGSQGKPDREVVRAYRQLIKGQAVQLNQVVALMNPARAETDLIGKESKVKAADDDYKAAVETTSVAKTAYDLAAQLKKRGAGSDWEVMTSLLQWRKSQQEEAKLWEGIVLAQSDVGMARIILEQHQIRSQVKNGIIKEIRKELGEAVKPGETIMELDSLDSFIAEAPIEVQYYLRLHVGMPVTIVPTQEESPDRVWRHHRGRVNSVAFTCDPAQPLIVSGSEDGTVQVWDRLMSAAKYGPFKLPAPVPVRVVACSPTNASLVVAGCSDGSINVWTLKDAGHAGSAPTRQIPPSDKAHNEAITCLAFSPDGKWLASGCADVSIKVWNVETGELAYAFDPDRGCVNGHQGPITSLYFTPQCRLVSASQDNSVRVWNLKERGVELQNVLSGRNGSVAQLGVSADGQYMLFDQGKTLQILSVEDGKTLSTLQNPTGNVGFQTLALFSPNASLLLTAGAGEGRLQLWSRPHDNELGYEVRQLVTDEHATVACAAFAPGNRLAASGTDDGFVYLWSIPSKEEVADHPIRNVPLSAINPAQNASSRQFQIGVEVRNQITPQYPTGRLIPGRPVTMFIQP